VVAAIVLSAVDAAFDMNTFQNNSSTTSTISTTPPQHLRNTFHNPSTTLPRLLHPTYTPAHLA
jgi:hypothetical protein